MNTISLFSKKAFLCWGLMFSLIMGCDKTTVIDYDPGSPITLNTKVIAIKSATELSMTGEIKNLNKEEVLDMGFILYDVAQSPENPKEISLGKAQVKVGPITYLYKAAKPFQIGKEYAYCIYVKTVKGYYKGQIENFTIDLIKTDLDKILKVTAGGNFELKGDFSQMNANTSLTILAKDYANEILIKLPYEVVQDGKSLRIQAPGKDVYHGRQYQIILNSQNLNGDNAYKRVLSNIQILAKLDTPANNEIFYTDELPITGIALPYEQRDDLKITIGGKTLPYSYGMKLTDFAPFDRVSLRWSYDNGSGAKDFPAPLKIKVPNGDQINLEQTLLHPYQQLAFHGLDLKRYFGETITKISIGSKEYENIQVMAEWIRFDPKELAPGEHDIVLSSPMFDVKLSKKLNIKPFDMTSLSKTEIYPYEDLTIKGSFIKGEYYNVKPSIYDYGTTLTAASETALKYRIEYVSAGNYDLELSLPRVEENNQKTIKKLPIKVLNPTITSVSSKTVKAGDTIILKGKGLAGISYLIVGMYTPNIIRHTNEEIEIRIQYTFIPGKYPITLITKGMGNDLKTDQIIEVL